VAHSRFVEHISHLVPILNSFLSLCSKPGNPTPLSTLVTNAKQSFEELHITSFVVMQKMALHAWGRTEMANSKEFIEYVLNRNTEFTHKGKEWKFSIVQTLATAPDAESLIAPPVLERLMRYIREGPFFVRTGAALAFESA